MSRYVHFITPENIEVSYELAGIGSRFLAAIADLGIQLAAAAGLLYLLSLLSSVLSILRAPMLGALPGWLAAGAILGTFVLLVGYPIFFEMRWAGQTPGKRLTRLRVVRDGGYPIDFYSSCVRNIVRLVDLLPPVYGSGLLSIFFSPEYKRLGDYAAGTLVIKESDPGRLLGSRAVASPLVAHYASAVRSVDNLTPEEFQAILRFVNRRHELEIPIQAHIAMRLAMPLMKRLGITIQIPIQWHYADLLEAIARRYVEERGVLHDWRDLEWLQDL
jgi:uncharacterized RDD family membrane protein YckC